MNMSARTIILSMILPQYQPNILSGKTGRAAVIFATISTGRTTRFSCVVFTACGDLKALPIKSNVSASHRKAWRPQYLPHQNEFGHQ